GGTRTASICAAAVALADALDRLPKQLRPPEGPITPSNDPKLYDPNRALADEMAAISVGIVEGEIRLDLHYADDSPAEVDMNVAWTAGGRFVEIQGSAENGGGFDMGQMQKMLELAVGGCRQLLSKMRQARGQE